MKSARLTVLLVLGCTLVLGLAACDSLQDTTTTAEVASTTTLAAETTTTVAAETTTTASAGSSSAAPVPTTTTKATSAMGALPAPKPKEKLLKGTWTWDIDNNVDGGGGDADVWYRIADELVHYLEAQNGAGFARVTGKSFDSLDRAALQAMSYTTTRLDTEGVDDPNVLDVGDVFAMHTNTGQYAKLQVVGYEPTTLNDGTVLNRYNIRLRYVLYPR